MNSNDLEELRYNVAHRMLKRMSPGSVFQYALDKMLDNLQHCDEDALKQMDPLTHKKKKKKANKAHGF